jgi:hypothetical protein
MDSPGVRKRDRALRRTATAAAALALLWALMGPGARPALAVEPALPGFEQLEAEGARIGEIRVVTENIFDTSDPLEDNALFRAANRLHIRTRPGVVERRLLFRTGEPVSVSRIDETERLLRASRYLYDVRIRPLAVRDGVVDIEVRTRDTWTFEPGLSLSRSGGANASSVSIREQNLLGTGTALSLGRFSNVDRSGTQFAVAMDQVGDTWVGVEYGESVNSDGERRVARIVRPFYGLDARWAAGASWLDDDRVEAVYEAGEVTARYRHVLTQGEIFAGLSTGRVAGWVRRTSAGLRIDDHAYRNEPGEAPPARLNPDERLRGPFVRVELIEDRYEKSRNIDQIARIEYLPLGIGAMGEIGRATTALGSSRDAWFYAMRISRGFEPRGRQRLLAAAQLSGRHADGRIERLRIGAQLRYHLPHAGRFGFYGGLQLDALENPAPLDLLQIGGDSGLRGYPLRYQSGTRRVLLTLEERAYSDWYLFRLFRVGAAAFFDVGRAWGGEPDNAFNPGWLANVGIGLRIGVDRASFGNVMHLDLAVPLNPDPTMQRVQFLLTTKASF